MTERTRDLVLIVVVVAMALVGIVTDVLGGSVDDAPRRGASGPEFAARTLFCPPAVERGSRSLQVAVASEGSGSARVGIETEATVPVDLPAGEILTSDIQGHAASNIVGYGVPLIGTAMQTYEGAVPGAGAAACADRPATEWYFPQGSSALGADQYFLVYNPFPDEAVVKIHFQTADGPVSKANLADVGVPAGKWVAVRVNEYILSRGLLSGVVTAVRGRVVAWRALLAKPDEGPRGVELTLGAAETSETWYLPQGAVTAGVEESLAIMNPSTEDATVTVSLLTADQTVQPARLAEVAIPPESSKRLDLSEMVGRNQRELGGVGAIVQSTNGVGVVVEHRIALEDGSSGVAAEIGAVAPAATWIVGPAAAAPIIDSIAVISAGPEDARVSISLLRAGRDPLEPAALQDIKVPGGLRVRIPIDEWTRGRPFVAVVTAEGGIVVERLATTADPDIAALMGIPMAP